MSCIQEGQGAEDGGREDEQLVSDGLPRPSPPRPASNNRPGGLAPRPIPVMFTGIVRELGTIARLERSQGVVRLTIDGPKTASQLERLDSLAVNGVCLSVVNLRQRLITCEVIRESLALTTLGGLKRGQRVNLEPSLAVSDRLNGHLVFGHVDGVGTVIGRRLLAGEQILEIRVAPQLRSFLVPKGPVAVDGISLTVGRQVTRATFTVHLIPETLRMTTLGGCRIGMRVNLEVDYLAKLVRQFVEQRPQHRESGWST